MMPAFKKECEGRRVKEQKKNTVAFKCDKQRRTPLLTTQLIARRSKYMEKTHPTTLSKNTIPEQPPKKIIAACALLWLRYTVNDSSTLSRAIHRTPY
jgi:hypothetical protein